MRSSKRCFTRHAAQFDFQFARNRRAGNARPARSQSLIGEARIQEAGASGTATVPAGIYAREFFRSSGLGVDQGERSCQQKTFARARGGESGNVDAGSIQTDSLLQERKVAVEIPAAEGPKISYTLAVSSLSKTRAKKLADYPRRPGSTKYSEVCVSRRSKTSYDGRCLEIVSSRSGFRRCHVLFCPALQWPADARRLAEKCDQTAVMLRCLPRRDGLLWLSSSAKTSLGSLLTVSAWMLFLHGARGPGLRGDAFPLWCHRAEALQEVNPRFEECRTLGASECALGTTSAAGAARIVRLAVLAFARAWVNSGHCALAGLIPRKTTFRSPFTNIHSARRAAVRCSSFDCDRFRTVLAASHLRGSSPSWYSGSSKSTAVDGFDWRLSDLRVH